MQIDLLKREKFENRHLGPDQKQIQEMLEAMGLKDLDHLISETIPQSILKNAPLKIPEAKNEFQFLQDFKKLAQTNKISRSYIGLGYYQSITPPVIQRNILENPGWYTAYTPYQAEIAQGRLEALINFQTMVMELTGMELANASLLDEATAAAEAMGMMYSNRKGNKKKANKIFVDEHVFPQTQSVLLTRAEPLGIELIVDRIENMDPNDPDIFSVIIQYPNGDGQIKDPTHVIAKAHAQGISTIVVADLLSLTLIKAPGEMGADVVVGSTQRFGIPLGFGGPHAAYFATREQFKRQIPGRIIGVSIDRYGKKAYRMALQTREQHIRREKATSNICTAQVLLAVMAGMYAVYHGPQGLKNIAARIHGLTLTLNDQLKKLGINQENECFFDTLKIDVLDENHKTKIREVSEAHNINFRYFDDHYVGISLDESANLADVSEIISIFKEVFDKKSEQENLSNQVSIAFPDNIERQSSYLQHEVFNSYHSEHEMLRYLKRLENKDLSLVHSMISLGSCTMKLNATTEMLPISWQEFASIHPFTPVEQVPGYLQMINELEAWLNEITGFAATSFQPNSGAQGEFTGLMVIRAYQAGKRESHRNVALIPSSAHGTNPASAVMAGMQVVIVDCDEHGNINIEDLKAKADKYKENLSALMVTYPSTHGVFEEDIIEICETIHQNGGQVYMDGANMNAQVGLTNPAIIGADVCHLNLHKTFCIPHGGGGPGMGPICVAKHLQPYLPANPFVKNTEQAIHAVTAAPFGSASILPISYAYIALMGAKGLKKATQIAILNTNYIKKHLTAHYKILYSGKFDRNAHEMIIDCREFKKVGIEVEDIAKRLMDYGYHAPTVSFPVPGTMMIEPTESESKEELDRFCAALIAIRKEITEIEEGIVSQDNNVLKNAPHTTEVVISEEWNFPYSREKAAYPLPFVRERKFWPAASRIDSAYGDRNLMCSCIPVAEYQEEEKTPEVITS